MVLLANTFLRQKSSTINANRYHQDEARNWSVKLLFVEVQKISWKNREQDYLAAYYKADNAFRRLGVIGIRDKFYGDKFLDTIKACIFIQYTCIMT